MLHSRIFQRSGRFTACALLGVLSLAPAGTFAQEITPPKITAPNTGLTVPKDSFDLRSNKVAVDGWSCGTDITEQAAGMLAELSRRRTLLSREVEAGTAMAENPAIMNNQDRGSRLQGFDDTLNRLRRDMPPQVFGLSRNREIGLASLPDDHARLFGLRPHTGDIVRFLSAGVSDEGATREFMKPDCFQSVNVVALSNRLRSAAQAVIDLRDQLRLVRDRVANGGGS